MKNRITYLILTSLTIYSCGKTQETRNESFSDLKDAETPAEETTPVPILVMSYPVESFSRWKEAFEARKSTREAMNIVDLGDLVDYENPRQVSVFLKTPNHEKSEEFAKSPEVREALKEMGVIGDPKIILLDALKLPEKPVTQKYRMMISHEVQDYDHWKSVFDQHEAERMDAGLELIGIGRALDNKNVVSVMFAFDDMDAAQIFASSNELKEAMKESGVISDPVLAWYENPKDN